MSKQNVLFGRILVHKWKCCDCSIKLFSFLSMSIVYCCVSFHITGWLLELCVCVYGSVCCMAYYKHWAYQTVCLTYTTKYHFSGERKKQNRNILKQLGSNWRTHRLASTVVYRTLRTTDLFLSMFCVLFEFWFHIINRSR